MTGKPESGGDWSAATWKGSRLQQHRAFHALPFSRKLELIEEMCEMAAQFGSASASTRSPAALHEDSPADQSRHDRQ
jgi:hypothetical protein